MSKNSLKMHAQYNKDCFLCQEQFRERFSSLPSKLAGDGLEEGLASRIHHAFSSMTVCHSEDYPERVASDFHDG
jgi:hypothetical protein